MSRSERQLKILDIISANSVETQEDITERLKKSGYSVTQATVSRDIKELGLIKLAGEDGVYRYRAGVRPEAVTARQTALFKSAVLNVDYAENIIVIKTVGGSAGPAAALIDSLKLPAIIGTVAGDDTVFVVVKPKDAVYGVIDKFKEFLS